MQLLKRSEKSSEPSHPRLNPLSDAEGQEVVRKAREGHYDLSICPTCKRGHEKPVPGVDLGWHVDSTYTDYLGDEQPCDCKWQDNLRRRYLLSEVPAGYWRYGKDDWFGDAEAWNVVDDYLNNWTEYRDTGIGLEFHSPNQGTGKTFLITYVARQLIQLGEAVHYHPFRGLMDIYQRPYEDRIEVESRLRHSTVLALDEVGAALHGGGQKDHYSTQFENLMRDRIDAGRVTLMTTNLGPTDLDKAYPRTYSLLAARQKRWAIAGTDVRREGTPFNILEDMAKRKATRSIQ
jgi:hypothetical protein